MSDLAAFCAAMAHTPIPVAADAELPDPTDPGPACVHASADASARMGWDTPDRGSSPSITVTRSRFEAGIHRLGLVTGRSAFTVHQSSPEAGVDGIDGEALFFRPQIIEVRLHYPTLGLVGFGGLIDDLWVVTGNQSSRIRPMAAHLSEASGLFDRSDLGMGLAWTSPSNLATAFVTVANGEGLRFRERNPEKNVNGIVAVRPLSTVVDREETPNALVIWGIVRNGTRGFDSERDDRVGGRITSDMKTVWGGAEFLSATGVGGDPSQRPKTWSLWAGTIPYGPLFAFARLDGHTAIPGNGDSRSTTLYTGLGTNWKGMHLYLGADRWSGGPQSRAPAGASESLTTVYLQLGTLQRVEGILP